MLPKSQVLQIIDNGKGRLDMEDVTFDIEYAQRSEEEGKRAEIVILSRKRAKILLYSDATFFSVRHELCHMKLFRMGIPLTNTMRDTRLFNRAEDYLRMVRIVEWYTNELQRRVFQEYYAVDEAGTPRPPPLTNLPELPKKRFTRKSVRFLIELAKKGETMV
jgi:hypothetical protein